MVGRKQLKEMGQAVLALLAAVALLWYVLFTGGEILSDLGLGRNGCPAGTKIDLGPCVPVSVMVVPDQTPVPVQMCTYPKAVCKTVTR